MNWDAIGTTMRRQAARSFIGITLLTLASVCYSDATPIEIDSTKAYLIIEANKLDSDMQQPKWIGLHSRDGNSTHISATKTVVAIQPGKYTIAHLDMNKDVNYSGHSLFLKSDRMAFEAGVIYLIGKITVSRKSRWSSKLEVVERHELLGKACDIAPLLFTTLPMSNVDELVTVDCSLF